MTRRKFDVAEAKVDKCATVKGLAEDNCCAEWRDCPLFFDLCVEGIRVQECGIKRIEKIQRFEDSFVYKDEQRQKQLRDALEIRYRRLDEHYYFLERIVAYWWKEANGNQEPDDDYDGGDYFGKLYKDEKYEIVGRMRSSLRLKNCG